MKHKKTHRTITVDNNEYCLQCDMGDKKPYIVETWSDDPVHGQTRHWVCSECRQDVDKDGVCKNHSFLQI